MSPGYSFVCTKPPIGGAYARRCISQSLNESINQRPTQLLLADACRLTSSWVLKSNKARVSKTFSLYQPANLIWQLLRSASGKMVGIKGAAASLCAIGTSWWYGGSPFAGYTALWPANHEGKYIIEAEGIRVAFTNLNGGAPTNLWINDTNGNEVDIILGLNQAKDYASYTGILGGAIGQSTTNCSLEAHGVKR